MSISLRSWDHKTEKVKMFSKENLEHPALTSGWNGVRSTLLYPKHSHERNCDFKFAVVVCDLPSSASLTYLVFQFSKMDFKVFGTKCYKNGPRAIFPKENCCFPENK